MSIAADLRALVKEYLESSKLMQLATCSNGQPWLSHVWFSHDDDLNLYFISKMERRHSKEISKQPKVAGGMVSIALEGPGQKIRGLSFQGAAEEVKGRYAITAAYYYHSKRWPQVEKLHRIDDFISGTSNARLYKIIPSLYVLFDEVNFPDQPRQELKLDEV